MIVPLNLPKAPLKLSKKNGQVFVWCEIRNKLLVCTPEEWVRQHIIHFLLNEQKIPKGLIAAEYQITYNSRKKRADIVVFNRNGKPYLIVECKAPQIEIDESVLYQIATYNHTLGVCHLMMSNGIQNIYAEINDKTGSLKYSENFPQLDFS
jgi:type I site-specific restriction endonuclease